MPKQLLHGADVITGFQQVVNALGTGDCEEQAADIVLKELET